MNTKVMAGMSSIPSRRDALADAVRSIIDQVDQLGVYLGGYDEIPPWLSSVDNIVIQRSQDDPNGDRGDAGKFWFAEGWDGFYLTVDDDIVYPPTYVEDTIDALTEVGVRSAVSCHGVRLKNPPVGSYYRDRHVFHWQRRIRHFRRVHIACTGWAAFHAGIVDTPIDAFAIPNMADIWFGILCQRQGIPAFTRPHPPSINATNDEAGYLYQNPKVDLSEAIYAQHSDDDADQTEAVNSYHRTDGWVLNGFS